MYTRWARVTTESIILYQQTILRINPDCVRIQASLCICSYSSNEEIVGEFLLPACPVQITTICMFSHIYKIQFTIHCFISKASSGSHTLQCKLKQGKGPALCYVYLIQERGGHCEVKELNSIISKICYYIHKEYLSA